MHFVDQSGTVSFTIITFFCWFDDNCWSRSTYLAYCRSCGFSILAPMTFAVRFVSAPSWYSTSHPRQLSLAIPSRAGTMSRCESWRVNRRYTSSASVISPCKPQKHRSTPSYGSLPVAREEIHSFIHSFICIRPMVHIKKNNNSRRKKKTEACIHTNIEKEQKSLNTQLVTWATLNWTEANTVVHCGHYRQHYND